MFQKPSTLPEFIDWLNATISGESFVQCTLGKPTKATANKNNPLKRALLRPVQVKQGIQILLVMTEARRDLTKTLAAEDALSYVREHLGVTFLSATVKTTERDLFVEISKSGALQVGTSKPSVTEIPSLSHNREKQFALSPKLPWLKDLGISNASGEIRSEMRDKFIQIERFINILKPVLAQIPSTKPKISVVDVGSGKSYLTFGLYQLLTNLFPSTTISVQGVEKRNDLVRLSNEVAHLHEMRGLKFVSGLAEDSTHKSADIVVALHACDTATDDALALALRARAKIICVAPCCHKYVRKKMKPDGVVALLCQHGIHAERIGETMTDALRASFLESHNYDTKVVEFIDKSHTAKNTMIIGVFAESRSKAMQELAKKNLSMLKTATGLSDFYLDRLAITASPTTSASDHTV